MESYSPLGFWDWGVVVSFFCVTLGIGFYFSKRGTGSLMEYFVAGRKMTWWVAGTSIVATSFAADTPLVVSGWMRTMGLERNWFWWGGIMGMMLCAFFFARLWRRSGLLTDVEFNELRYAGKPAAGLRMFHASYRSFIQNTLVMGWVTLAMTKILEVTLSLPTLVFVEGSFLPEFVAQGVALETVLDRESIAQWPLVGAAIISPKVVGIVVCLTSATLYSAVSGIWGVMATDVFQFILAMTGSLVLMVVAFMIAGGPKAMVVQAEEAVREGLVVNRVAENRSEITLERLRTVLGPDVNEADLFQAGIFEFREQGDGEEPVMAYWAVGGMNEVQVAERLQAAGLTNAESEAVLGLWREAFTVSLAAFSDSKVVEKLLEAGLLAEDADIIDPTGSGPESYRLVDISLSQEALRAALEEAGVDDKGAVMAVWRNDQVVVASKLTRFLPPFDLKGGGLLAIWALVVFLGLQWWAGGAGEGFLCQRLFSCKDERHSLMAMLWYNVAMFALRPWPWIVVGVASLFLIPDITAYGLNYDPEHAYVVMLMKYLPVGFKGLMVAALMAAYMSTISTHINFGASYVVNDLYKRFIHPQADDRRLVLISQGMSLFLALLAALYAYFADSVGNSWLTYFEIMSGTGLVILLRWYWWRVNAWSELAAMASSLTLFMLMNHTAVFQGIFGLWGAPLYWLDAYAVRFTLNIVLTTCIWLTVTMLTPPEPKAHLVAFYKRVHPSGSWGPIARAASIEVPYKVGRLECVCWLLGVSGLFSMIFCIGKACFGFYIQSLGFGIYSALATFLILKLVHKMDWSDLEEKPKPVLPKTLAQ